MGWLSSLFGSNIGTACKVCGGHVDAQTGIIGATPTRFPAFGVKCKKCEVHVHLRCAKKSVYRDEGDTYTYYACPTCQETLYIS